MDGSAANLYFSAGTIVAGEVGVTRHPAKNRPESDVPGFRLYGEPISPATPAFLHVEYIDTRSRKHGWLIQPHRHVELHQVFLILQGGGTVRIDDQILECRAPSLLNLPPSVVHGFEWEAGTNGYVLTVAAAVIADIVRRYPELDSAMREAAHLVCAEGEPAGLRVALQALMTEIGWSESAASPVAEAHLLLCLAEVARGRRAEGSASEVGLGRDCALFQRFRHELDGVFTSRISIGELARRLGVSNRRLNTACREAAGHSPLQVLHERMLVEAKRKLIYTVKPIAEIAYELGFDDPAYFTRFFTLRVGCSPRRFRQLRGSEHGTQSEPVRGR
jgi:AraC family transcriptional activator of pobA